MWGMRNKKLINHLCFVVFFPCFSKGMCFSILFAFFFVEHSYFLFLLCFCFSLCLFMRKMFFVFLLQVVSPFDITCVVLVMLLMFCVVLFLIFIMVVCCKCLSWFWCCCQHLLWLASSQHLCIC